MSRHPDVSRHALPVWWRGLVLPAALVAAWLIAGLLEISHSPLFVPIGSVLRAAFDAIANGQLPGAVGATLLRAATGWALGASAGLSVGLLLGLSHWGRHIAAPTLHAARQVALFAWIPLLSAWFGNGEVMKIALIALSAFFPVMLNAEAGSRDVPVPYREVASLLAFDRRSEILCVILPAAMPKIISGLELGFAAAWIGTIGAEYLIGTGYMNALADGIGGYLAAARENARLDLVIVGIAALGTTGLVLDRLIVHLAAKWGAWQTQSQ
jgi:sulfonate transport system permease protein